MMIIKRLIITLISSQILISCNDINNKNPKVEKVNYKVVEAQLDHVVEKREGCRISVLNFVLSIENASSVTQRIRFPNYSDNCDREIESGNLYWSVNKNYIRLAAAPSDSLVIIHPFESKRVVVKAMFNLIGNNLHSMVQYYHDWFKMPFSIHCLADEAHIIFRKCNTFEVKLFLDDVLTNSSDSLRYNKTTSGPPIINNILPKAPSKEPEL